MSEGPGTAFADPRIAIGAQPISVDAPAGTDIRRDADFETLEAELRRMDADGPGAVRWRTVIEGATAILSQRAKDLLVGVWLAYGLAREESWHGLAVGLVILRDMVNDHWENMQPSVKRERARIGATEWLVGRLVPLVTGWQAEERAGPAIVAAAEALDDLDRGMNERLTKENVAFGELVRALRPHADATRRAAAEAADRVVREAAKLQEAPAATETIEKAPPPPPVEQAPPPPPPRPVAVAAPPPVTAPPASAGPELDRAVTQLETAMRQHAEALRVANLFDPRSYVLLRTATWLGINQLPPQQGSRTPLPPPAQDRVAAVEAMRQAGKLDDAVRALESLISSSPFFLDAQRIVRDILETMGVQAEAAKMAVTTQVAAFLRRLPGVEDLAYSDGRPFANTSTREWLTSLAASGNGGEAAADAEQGAVKAALQLASAGKLPDAFALLRDEIRHAGGARARFNLNLLQAQICLEANLTAMAVPLAIGLTRTVGEYNLEGWEPALAARAAEFAVRALTHAEAIKYATESERLAALQIARIRLAALDPAAAARLGR